MIYIYWDILYVSPHSGLASLHNKHVLTPSLLQSQVKDFQTCYILGLIINISLYVCSSISYHILGISISEKKCHRLFFLPSSLITTCTSSSLAVGQFIPHSQLNALAKPNNQKLIQAHIEILMCIYTHRIHFQYFFPNRDISYQFPTEAKPSQKSPALLYLKSPIPFSCHSPKFLNLQDFTTEICNL